METTQPQFQQQYNPQTALPNATAILVLGIVAIIGCFCYGIVGLVCGIIALVLAKKDLALYNANPGAYTAASYSNVKAGRVCAIIGLSLSIIYALIIIIMIVTIGVAGLSNPQEMFRNFQ